MRPLRYLTPLFLLLAAVMAAALAGGSSSAGAAPAGPTMLLDERLPAVEGTTAIACHASYRPGQAGIATRTVQAPAGVGFLEIGLGGAKGDWDMAIFDAAGNVLAAGAELGAVESAAGWTATGGALRVQACRRSGSAPFIGVTVTREGVAGNAAAMKADPPQLVSVSTPTRADKDRLTALGVDLTEHGGTDALGVVLHSAADRELLRRNGFTFEVLVGDLVKQSFLQRRAEQVAPRRRAAARSLPSGRTGTYRRLVDYNEEMKTLAAENPGLVRAFVMPNKTWLGKEVMGIEITENVNRQDGKPAFFNMGVHHAREWPAGEMPMEWAHELINGFKSGDQRAVNVVKNSRNIIVPIVNPDGFEASREAGQLSPTNMGAGQPEAVPDIAYLAAGATTGGEYRRKNCRLPDNSEAGNCATSAGIAEPGVDPNRNYGGLWGGPGAEASDVSAQDYRGPGPFSEPETRNIQQVVSTNQVMSLITNHTTAALVLRAPGLASLGDPVDEDKGYKALGDAMAKENGYFSQNGFELYDTTGTTEDWSYNATGGFGFTFEIYCGDPDYATGDCNDPAFHPTYATGVEREWDGDNPVADHVNDPAGAYDGKGNREAYYIAAESALNEQRHSVIEGSAPAGATLRLTKSFKTATFPQPPDDEPILFDDKLETVYEVGDNGKFEWHVNPSTRPIVAKPRGKEGAGEPSPEEVTDGSVATGSSETGDGPDDGAAVPAPDATGAMPPGTTSYNDHPFAIPATGDNASLSIAVEWTTPVSDWDIELFEDTNANGRSDPGTDKSVTTSANGTSNAEEVSIAGDEALAKGKQYVLRVVNYAVVPVTDPTYTVTKTYEGFEPFQPATTESWTLTCEVGGKVLQTEQVEIARGERKTPDLSACASAAPGAGPGSGSGSGPGADGPTACVSRKGFRSFGVRPRRRGAAALRFRRTGRAKGRVAITVFQQARRRRIVNNRAVARFVRSKSFRWNGKANIAGKRVRNGYFFVRFRVGTGAGADTRRVALRRRGGRFKVVRPFHRRATCGLLRQYKLGRTAFGGRSRKALRISYLLGSRADVRVRVKRGSRVVKRFRANDAAADGFKRFRLRAKGLKRGVYKVRLTARAGGRTARATLVSRKL